MDAEKLLRETVERIKNGTLTDFSPLIALFQYERKPMTLDGHFMFLPLFSLERPKYISLQTGRQVSKSFTSAEVSLLTTGMIESFNSIYIAPRFEQIKRFNSQVLHPLMKSSPATPLLIDKEGSYSIEMKTFLNGNSLTLAHSYLNPDSVRGLTNCGSLQVDESVRGDTEILIFHLTDCQDGVYYISDRPEIVPISEVKQGDIVLSFTEDGCIYSPVVRDASYHGRRAVFKVTTQSGRSLCCTADHMLQTNLGGMRLSEVIDYGCNSRDGARTSAEGRNQRLCVECDCGDDSRRCECSSSASLGQCELRPSMEPQHQTERLLGIQSEHIIRARYSTSIREAESWLRRLLGGVGNTLLTDIYIACADDISDGGRSKNNHSGASEVVNASCRSCVVVRRRWKSRQRSKCWRHLHERLYSGRGGASENVVARDVGDIYAGTSRKTLKYRSARGCHLRGVRRFCGALKLSSSILARLDGLQTNVSYETLCTLRKIVSGNDADTLLLRGVQGDRTEAEQERVYRALPKRKSRRDIKKRCSLSRSTPGGDSGEVSCNLCVYDRGAACTQGAILQNVCGEESGKAQRTTAGEACSQEGRSGVRAQIKGRAPTVLSTKNGGSGAACSTAGVVPEGAEKTRTEAARPGVSAEISCRTPRSVCRAASACECSQKRADAKRSRVSRKKISRGSGTSGAQTGTETSNGARAVEFVLDRIVSIEYVDEEDVYDIEVVGTHNYVLANGMCSYNCQDINPDFLPVFESTTDASKYGCIQTTGTPKTSDTLLTLQFNKSSQCHWAIKCPHCSRWSIASIDEQLIKMIGKEGLSCAYCGKILDPRKGGWLPKFPDRQRFHAGYHIPQIILPMHCENPTKWKVLRSRQTEWTQSKFLNEVLGVECDQATKLLTRDDLIAASNPWPNTLATAVEKRKLFDTVFIGVDWSGGGGGFSRTAICALGHATGSRESHVIFLETLPHGLTPEEEADRVAHVYSMLRADMLAHDYTGAGFVRESVLLGRHPYMRDHIYPLAYVFRTGKQLVQYQESGSRKSANVDKTRSLLLTFNSIRSKLLRLPNFNPADNNAPQLELLNIVERPQEFSKSNIKEVYLLQRAPGRYDDAAHAINIAFIAQCDLTEDWPDFSMDPKYEMTEGALQEITGGSNEVLTY